MTSRSLWLLFGISVVAGILQTKPVLAEPINVKPGQDPGGTAIAILSPPISLTSPEVVQKLARDGEGVAIGWDFSKRPKSSDDQANTSAQSRGASLASTLAAHGGVRLVPVFVDPLRPATWAQAVAFVAQTPARIVLVPFATTTDTDWIAFRAAAEHFPNLLFVVPAHATTGVANGTPLDDVQDRDGASAVYPAALQLANVLNVGRVASKDTDVVVATGEPGASLETALALTATSLLFCPPDKAGPSPEFTKVQALAKLGDLGTPQQNDATHAPSSLTFRPCADASK